MTVQVLQDNAQIGIARQELVGMGVSQLESPGLLRSLLRKLGLKRGMAVGDMVKSWDVLSTLNFIKGHVKPGEPILDMGCYASEVLVALHTLGYTKLAGADLNPNLMRMPHGDSIRYEVTDFLHTPYEDGSFQAITSISVMEHGFDGAATLKEVSRLLKPGGYFIASFDYWPAKIDTTGTKFFGMNWTIFSKDEISKFIIDAANYGLRPVGEMKYDAKDKPIEHGGKQYTFGWLVLTRAG